MKTIQDHILHLGRIAKANHDEFEYSFPVELTSSRAVLFSFECRESEDNHVIISSAGDSPELAIMYAMKHIREACKDWGYKYVD